MSVTKTSGVGAAAIALAALTLAVGPAGCKDDADGCLFERLCSEDSNCPEDYVCNQLLEPPQCQRLDCLGHGAVCDRDALCPESLVCSESFDPPQCGGSNGDPCTTLDKNCAEGFACRIPLPDDDRDVCRPVGALGSACRAEEPTCDGDLLCEVRGVSRDATTFSVIERCFPERLPAGSSCSYGWECELVLQYGMCDEGLCQ